MKSEYQQVLALFGEGWSQVNSDAENHRWISVGAVNFQFDERQDLASFSYGSNPPVRRTPREGAHILDNK